MTMCRILCVARAGFYAWLHNPVSARDKDNQRLLALIRDSYSLSGGVYGYRRAHGDLNEIGETCGKNRVAEGHSKMEALRCLKRYISREVYTLLRNKNRQINSTQIMA